MILVSALIVASAAPQIDMGDIQARLFYSETGRLSDDLLARKKPFIFWNTIIGEGDAEENADDILIAVTMSAGKFGAREDNERNIDSPLVLKATNEKGEIISNVQKHAHRNRRFNDSRHLARRRDLCRSCYS